MLIKGCIQLGYAPDMEEKITVLPVDFVSHAIVTISLNHHSHGKVFHVDHPIGMMWSDLIAWLNEYGYKVKLISIKDWQKKLMHISQDNALFPFLPYYLALHEQYKSPVVAIDNTRKILDSENIAYPVIDDTLLNTYLDYLCKSEFLPMPDRAQEKELS